MTTVKKNCAEVKNWNKKLTNLVQDLENTIDGFSKLLINDKENCESKNKTIPIKVFQIQGEKSLKESTKVDPNTLQRIIRNGIYNLRKSSSPMPSRNNMEACSCRSSSIELVLKIDKNSNNKQRKKKKKNVRGKSIEKRRTSSYL